MFCITSRHSRGIRDVISTSANECKFQKRWRFVRVCFTTDWIYWIRVNLTFSVDPFKSHESIFAGPLLTRLYCVTQLQVREVLSIINAYYVSKDASSTLFQGCSLMGLRLAILLWVFLWDRSSCSSSFLNLLRSCCECAYMEVTNLGFKVVSTLNIPHAWQCISIAWVSLQLLQESHYYGNPEAAFRHNVQLGLSLISYRTHNPRKCWSLKRRVQNWELWSVYSPQFS